MRIAIFGGNGFIGSRLAMELARRGHSLALPVRDRERAKKDLILLPETDVFAYSPNKPSTMSRALIGADAVVNLVGILNERGSNHKFAQAHGEFVRLLTERCKAHNVRYFVQMSSIGASSNASSAYLRSKAKAETIVSTNDFFRYTIIRQSVIFGDGDKFINQFAGILRHFPVVPLPCAYAQMQPIAISDAVDLIARAIENDALQNTIWQAGGPEILTLQEIVNKIAHAMQVRRKILPLGGGLSYATAAIAEMIPFVHGFSRDNCLSVKTPSVCPKNSNDAKLQLGNLMSLESGLLQMFGEKEESVLGRFRTAARR